MLGGVFGWNPDEFYHFEFWAFLLYHLTLMVLFGLSLRNPTEFATASRFVGVMVVSWLMTVGVLLFIRHELIASTVTPDIGLFLLHCYVWIQLAARPVTAILYGIVCWLRSGAAGLKSFAMAIGLSCLVVIGWMILHETFWPSVEFEGNNPTREAFWMGFTSPDVIVNWVVWYWFLFRPSRRVNCIPPGLQLT